MPAVLRPAEDRDLPELRRMMAALQDVERAVHPDSRPPGAEVAETHVDHLRETTESNQGLYLVAEEGERLVGFLVAYVEVEEEAYLDLSHQRAGRIADIWIDPDRRGSDLADRFLDAAEDHFRALGLSILLINYLTDNARAGAAYAKRGFRPLETMLYREIVRE